LFLQRHHNFMNNSASTMADQSQTATNKQSEPAPCKRDCGFFGNAATGGFCSKCFSDAQKSKEAVAAAVVAPVSPETTCAKIPEKVTPRAVEINDNAAVESPTKTPKLSSTAASAAPATDTVETPAVPEKPPAEVANAPAKKKKKKKTSYKNMMASMMKEKTRDTDKDSAKDAAIRKVTGGGVFSKIDKI